MLTSSLIRVKLRISQRDCGFFQKQYSLEEWP